MIRCIAIFLTMTLAFATSAIATDILVTDDVERYDGFDRLMGPNTAVAGDSGVYVLSFSDVGVAPDLSYMNGINSSFSTTGNFDNYGETEAGHIWAFSAADTCYAMVGADAADPPSTYKFFGATEVCDDSAYSGTISFRWGMAGTDGTDFTWIFKASSTEYHSFRLSQRLCEGTLPTLVDSFTTSAGDQYHMFGAPAQGGLVVINAAANELHYIEAGGVVNEDAMTTVFDSLLLERGPSATVNTYGIAMCPGNPDGQNDTVYIAAVDSATLTTEIFTCVVDSAGGTVSFVDSVEVSTGTAATANATDSLGARNPCLMTAGDGLIYFERGHADPSGRPDSARIDMYVLQDRSDLSGEWVKSVLAIEIVASKRLGQISAPWQPVMHSTTPTDSIIPYVAWHDWATTGAAHEVWITPDTLATPSAAAPAAVVVPNFIHSIDGAGLRQSAEGVSVIHGPL